MTGGHHGGKLSGLQFDESDPRYPGNRLKKGSLKAYTLGQYCNGWSGIPCDYQQLLNKASQQ
jgi:hypothetical protein